jgi:hypothetical protein
MVAGDWGFGMTATAERSDMAKGKGRLKGPEGDNVAVKLDRSVVAMAKMIAARRGITLTEFLTELTRGPVEREFEKEMRRLGSKGDQG